MSTPHPQSIKILVADDRLEILDDFKKILCHTDNSDSEFFNLQKEIFGDKTYQEISTNNQFQNTYDITGVSQGHEAIELVHNAISENTPFAIAFLDIRMPPGIDGVETAVELHKLDPSLHIVFISAYSDFSRDEIINRVGPGSKDKILYISKPFSADEIRYTVETLAEKWRLHSMLKKHQEKTHTVESFTIHALIELITNKKSKDTPNLLRFAKFTQLLTTALCQCEEEDYASYIDSNYLEDIVKACILHDIGIAEIPDTILSNDRPLNDDDRDLIKNHCHKGFTIIDELVKNLGQQTFLTLAKEIACSHHEKYDGTGYPDGLKGKEIPLSARIVALIHVYDALISSRPQRAALSHSEACKVLLEDMGESFFDPSILSAFKNVEKQFLELNDKESRI